LNYDIIVVGSGPAGAYLAYKLADFGADVLILEKNKWPRYKACGGVVSEKTINLLKKENIELPDKLIKNRVKNFIFRFNFIDNYETNYNGPSVKLTNRKIFDDYLLNQAVKKGAHFLDSSEVKNIYKDEKLIRAEAASKSYRAKMIIGADGANSLVAKAFNAYPNRIKENKGTALEAEIYHYSGVEFFDYIKENKIIIDFLEIEKGYAWIFPKKDQLSIGLGSLVFEKMNLKNMLFEYLRKIRIETDPDDIFLRGHLLPTFSEKKRIIRAGESYLLIGDAAFLADAFIGEGIYSALKSADLAFKSIIQKLEDADQDLRIYESELNKKLIPELTAAEKLSEIFYKRRKYVQKILKVRPDILDEFLAAVQGESSYSELSSLFSFLKKVFK